MFDVKNRIIVYESANEQIPPIAIDSPQKLTIKEESVEKRI